MFACVCRDGSVGGPFKHPPPIAHRSPIYVIQTPGYRSTSKARPRQKLAVPAQIFIVFVVLVCVSNKIGVSMPPATRHSFAGPWIASHSSHTVVGIYLPVPGVVWTNVRRRCVPLRGSIIFLVALYDFYVLQKSYIHIGTSWITHKPELGYHAKRKAKFS